MFTGLVGDRGRVAAVEPRDGATRLTIETSWPAGTLDDGESVAVDGVCLTVVAATERRFVTDAVAATLARTTLGGLDQGAVVHLERSLRLGDRLGGHLVQGHVDAVARVRSVERRGADCRLRVELPDELAPYVALRGSIALAGVSLTVAGLGQGWLEVALIPETLRRTRLGELAPGDPLNVEVDLVARYLERLSPPRGGSP